MGICRIKSWILARRSDLLSRARPFAGVAIVGVSALLLCLSLAGCSQPPHLEEAIEAMRNAESFDFVEDWSILGSGGSFSRTTGTYQSPDKVSTQTSYGRAWTHQPSTFPQIVSPPYVPSANSPPYPTPSHYGHPGTPMREETTRSQSISIGSEGYVMDPAPGDWTKYQPGTVFGGPWIFANPVGTLIKEISDSPRYKNKGEMILDGVHVRHLTWRTHTVGPPKESFRQVDVFIGTGDSLVRRLVVSESWIPVPCEEDVPCLLIAVYPGSTESILEFTFPGHQTPILAPAV